MNGVETISSVVAPIGLLVCDNHQNIVNVDRMFEEMFSVPSERILGKPIYEVLGSEDLHADLLSLFLFGEPISDRLCWATLPGKDNARLIRLNASSIRLEDQNENDGYFVSVEDVSID